MTKQDIERMLTELQAGSTTAFTELYRATAKGVFGVIYSVVKDKSLAEDLMQDSFIKINSQINSYQASGNGFAWMLTIAKNTALNELRKRRKETSVDFNENPNVFGQYDLTECETPLLDLAKTVLKAQEYEIVTLHLLSGMKHGEIAKHLSRPIGTIMWAYNNALAKLRRSYKA